MLTTIDRIAERNAGILLLIGRIAMALLFTLDLYGKLMNINGWMGARNLSALPLPWAWALGGLVLLLVGDVGVILGYKARLGALALAIFCLGAAILGHPFWADPAQQTQFLKDLALTGGFLVLFVHGPGPYSIDARR